MKVNVKGVGPVSLTQQNYVATGGQASVYVKSGIAYKVYTDPKNTIPTDKFAELSAIADDHVIKPEALLLNDNDSPIGYTMKAVTSPYSLGQLFTKGFRDRTHVTNDHIIGVASKLREHVQNVHNANVLVVDLNEFNILVPDSLDDVYLIDVDSFQTRGYPATVIMPSVRDFSVPSSKFSPLSDWYSYGVLTFQLFVGIHPYRGTHQPSMTVEKDKRLEHRMRNNISAFRSDVALPGCCYPLDNIPQVFRQWLKAVLDEGKRVAPPDPKGLTPIATLHTIIKQDVVSTDKLRITKLFAIDGALVTCAEDGINCMTLSKNQHSYILAVDGSRIAAIQALPPNLVLGCTPKLNRPIGLYIDNGTLHVIDFQSKATLSCGSAETLVKSGPSSFHIKKGPSIYELDFLERSTLHVGSHSVANVLEKASKLYDGCCVQNILGSVFVSVFPRPKTGYQVRIPELDNYRIIDAKFSGATLMVYGAINGVYDRIIVKFDDAYEKYDILKVQDVTPSALNFVTLDNKVCVSITEEEKLEAFLGKKGASSSKIAALPLPLNGSTKLLRAKGKVAFEHNGAIYKIEMA